MSPDFQRRSDGWRDYKDGTGQRQVRPNKIKDEGTVVVKRIPPTTTTDAIDCLDRGRDAQGKLKVNSHDSLLSRRNRNKAPTGRERRNSWSDALMPLRIAKSRSTPYHGHPK